MTLVGHPPTTRSSLPPLPQHDSCPVCLTPSSQCKLFGLVCGHMFCSLCWAEYLTSKIHCGKAAGESSVYPTLLTYSLLSSILSFPLFFFVPLSLPLSFPFSSFLLLTPSSFFSLIPSPSLFIFFPFSLSLPLPLFLPPNTEIECMECSVRVSLEEVQSLLQSSAEVYAKYLRFALTEFVQVGVVWLYST